jgi:hypothetical protein
MYGFVLARVKHGESSGAGGGFGCRFSRGGLYSENRAANVSERIARTPSPFVARFHRQAAHRSGAGGRVANGSCGR